MRRPCWSAAACPAAASSRERDRSSHRSGGWEAGASRPPGGGSPRGPAEPAPRPHRARPPCPAVPASAAPRLAEPRPSHLRRGLVEQRAQPTRLSGGHHSGLSRWCHQENSVVLDQNGHRSVPTERVVAVDPSLWFSHGISLRGTPDSVFIGRWPCSPHRGSGDSLVCWTGPTRAVVQSGKLLGRVSVGVLGAAPSGPLYLVTAAPLPVTPRLVERGRPLFFSPCPLRVHPSAVSGIFLRPELSYAVRSSYTVRGTR